MKNDVNDQLFQELNLQTYFKNLKMIVNSAYDFFNSYSFFEIHGIKKSESGNYIAVDSYDSRYYCLNNGMIVEYTRAEGAKLKSVNFIDELERCYLSREKDECNLVFDQFTEMTLVEKGGSFVRVGWFSSLEDTPLMYNPKTQPKGKWLISSRNVIDGSRINCEYDSLLEKLKVDTLDRQKEYIFHIPPPPNKRKLVVDESGSVDVISAPAITEQQPKLISTYVHNIVTLRKELRYRQPETCNINNSRDVFDILSKNPTKELVAFHPIRGKYILIGIKQLSQEIHDIETSVLNAQQNMKRSYSSEFYRLANAKCDNFETELSKTFFPRNYILERELKELPMYLMNIFLYGKNGDYSANELHLISKIKASGMKSLVAIKVYDLVINHLATCSPFVIMEMIKEMTDKSKDQVK